MSTQARPESSLDRAARQRAAWRVRDRYQEAQHGRAQLVLYTATALDAIRGAFSADAANIRAGARCMQLRVGGNLWMSDTSDEYRDHVVAIMEARGRVLIHGLGLGCYLAAILTKPEVTHVDVVELDPDVIALVGPYYAHDARVRIHHGDAFTFAWPKGTRWNTVWHDIWADKCTDDLEAHGKLARKFARRCDWQGAWAHEFLLYHRRRGG